MKKIQAISLVIGTAALVVGAAAYAAAKIAGMEVPSKHDNDEMRNTPYVPEEEQEAGAHDEQAVQAEDAQADEEQAEKPDEVTEAAAEEADASLEEAEAVPVEEAEAVSEEGAEDAPEEAEDALEEKQDPANLEEYIKLNPEERANLDAVRDSFAADGVRTDISFADNTMFFDFVMDGVEDEETKGILKPDLEGFLEDQTETYRNIVKQLEEDTGFGDIKMIVIFMDENGEQIVSGHYDETGRTM